MTRRGRGLPTQRHSHSIPPINQRGLICWEPAMAALVLPDLPGSEALKLCSERLQSGLMEAEPAPLSDVMRTLKNALAATSKFRPVQNFPCF